jgi:uncharacterized LabA/DUF88 family protein
MTCGGGTPTRVAKIALFIDGEDLHLSAKALGFDLDYHKLLEKFRSRGIILRAIYYIAIAQNQETSIRPLVDWLDYNGFSIISMSTKKYVDVGGRRKVRSNMHIELAVDAMALAEQLDEMVLFSGNRDFQSVVKAVQRRGVRVTVVSTIATSPVPTNCVDKPTALSISLICVAVVPGIPPIAELHATIHNVRPVATALPRASGSKKTIACLCLGILHEQSMQFRWDRTRPGFCLTIRDTGCECHAPSLLRRSGHLDKD